MQYNQTLYLLWRKEGTQSVDAWVAVPFNSDTYYSILESIIQAAECDDCIISDSCTVLIQKSAETGTFCEAFFITYPKDSTYLETSFSARLVRYMPKDWMDCFIEINNDDAINFIVFPRKYRNDDL